jgi:SAM-dependent methyltransferase
MPPDERRLSIPSLRRRAHAFARGSRSFLLQLASPLDRAALILNGKGDLPPLRLRRQAGPLPAFERAASEYVGLVSALIGLPPAGRILDVGCGAGAFAIMLRGRMSAAGRYVGFDVDTASIRWCQRHLADARFEFRLYDYWNATYRPKGQRFRPWPAETAAWDVVLLKSLFTHMLPDDVEFYAAELARVLAPDGSALVTAFTYTAIDDPVRERFRHAGSGFRFARAGAPEAAVAYPRDWLLGVLAANALSADFHPGFWRPQDGPTLAFQDVIVVRHRSGAAAGEASDSGAALP